MNSKASPEGNRVLVFGFCAAVLLGAYLLFTFEPLVGKLVTPGFGGTASIWSVCLLFFQGALLGGYFLAYTLTRLKPRFQVLVYAAILIVSVAFAKPPALESWICNDVNNPAIDLIGALTTRLALPFVVLSTISIMMQTWYTRLKLGDPYPLYSVSNIGSMAALLAYPLLVEPLLTLNETRLVFCIGYVALVGLLIALSVFVFRADQKGRLQSLTEKIEPPKPKDFAMWCYLSASGSISLLAFTTYITQDISPIPLFWVLPLALYLITFIILFAKPDVYSRQLFAYIPLVLWLSELFVPKESFGILLVVNLLLLFFMCMMFHGELVARRPDPQHLPAFYVSMALGGAIGGVFVNFVAPAVFTFYAERQLSIVLLVVLILGLLLAGRFQTSGITSSGKISALLNRSFNYVNIVVLCLLSLALCALPFFVYRNVVASERNFYSSIQIQREQVEGLDALAMVHGRVKHGMEFQNVAREQSPGLYWEPVALAMQLARASSPSGETQVSNQPLKCGIVGLGVGFGAACGREGDYIKFYELDPKVEKLARQYFTYLAKSKAKVIVEIGDGRSVLSRESAQNYDLLIIDVFNGNAIPVHLLTREALEIYSKHLKPDGVLVFHVSNLYLNLPPVISNLAKERQLNAATITMEDSTYVVLSKDAHVVDRLKSFYDEGKTVYRRPIVITKTVSDDKQRVWCDDYVNLLPLIRDPWRTDWSE